MQTVYSVWGLGFGDVEDTWELCSLHKTREGAERAKQTLTDNDIDPGWLRIDEEQLKD